MSAAMAQHATRLGAHAHRSMQELIEARSAGLEVPESAVTAVDVLAALSIAWAHNAHGSPAPRAALAALGLLDAPAHLRHALTNPTGDTHP